MSPLVSIMTPCYNGEKFVGRFLKSVLAQTYDNIELVIVNDGSTDNTEAEIKNFIPKFEERGYKLIYIHQENGGVASTYNAMMDKLTGEFINWTDSDDILTPDSIEKRVNFLLKNPEYDFCMCQMYEVLEENTEKILGVMKRNPPPPSEDNLFMDFLIERNVIFPNVWLVRREVFFQAHPTKKIYLSRHGQNWQFLLPLTYKFKCGYINEPLVFYVVRGNSMSHSPKKLQEEVERYLDFINLQTYTLKQLNLPNETEMLNFVWARFMHKILMLGISHGEENLIIECCQKAAEKNLDIFGGDFFDVKFLIERYIFPKMNLQMRLAEMKNDISKLNNKYK